MSIKILCDKLKKYMGNTIISTLYLFLPCYVANMAPVIAKRFNILSSLAVPIDGSRDGKEGVLGKNKTYRGLIVGLLAGVITAEFQLLLCRFDFSNSINLFPLQADNAVLWGFLLGAGALAGDLVKSLIKRKVGLKPGERWIPWDQLDMVVGGIAFGSLMYRFSWTNVIILLIISPILIISVNIFSYLMRIKDNW